MAGIFPPADRNGVPPGGNVCNGFSPTHPVIGEGPLYYAADCATVLDACSPNAWISEILAALDVGFGVAYNANRQDNLGTALRDAIAAIYRAIDTRVLRAGDTMLGPLELARDPQNPMEAATRRWVIDQDGLLDNALRQLIADQIAAVTAAYQLAISIVDERKINRAGDTMLGPLMLARAPQEQMEAATRAYVDSQVGAGGAVPEAPMDGIVYARAMGAWVPVSLDDGEYDGVGLVSAGSTRRRDDGEY